MGFALPIAKIAIPLVSGAVQAAGTGAQNKQQGALTDIAIQQQNIETLQKQNLEAERSADLTAAQELQVSTSGIELQGSPLEVIEGSIRQSQRVQNQLATAGEISKGNLRIAGKLKQNDPFLDILRGVGKSVIRGVQQ